MTVGKRLRKNGVVRGEDVERRLDDMLEARRDLCDVRMDALEQLLQVRIQSVEKGIEIADKVNTARLEALNELREMVTTMMGNFVLRSEYSAGHERVRDDIIDLQKGRANAEGKASMGAFYLTLVISGFGLVLSAVAIFH
jgi:hypothetical protein